MKRYIILVAAIIMQMCLGATYSWSVYVQPLKDLTGLLQGPVQVPFTVFYFAFPATMMLAGILLPRLGPKRCAMTGGMIFGSGWLLAALGHTHFALTVTGIGLFGGIGAGLAYIVPIAVCIRWFPNHKGLVSGIAVAGFGGGAALVSQIGGLLMNSHELTPFRTFGIFGTAFFILVTSAGAAMQPPQTEQARNARPLITSEIVSRIRFRILYAAMFTGLVAGFAVNANLRELYSGQNVRACIMAVSLFAIANAAGRVIWGLIFDRVCSATAVQANLAGQALVLLAAPWLLDSVAGLLTVAVLTGFNYGGVLVVYVSSAARSWGNAHVGQVYGWLFSANIPAAFSPILAGLAYDHFGNFDMALWTIAGMLVMAALMVQKTAPLLNTDQALAHRG